ncbi:MAG: STAS domain-containing protein [Planctomycetota bacterium]|nr:STAS domain-containing protein [Planctomycetota bacterium]
MKIERKTAADGDVTILAFTGEFDAFNLPTISEKIDTLISKGCTKLVFNLHLLKFINSSALGYLIKTHKRLKQLDGELVLSQPSKFFQTTIATLGIDQIFKIYANDAEAVTYFAETGVAEQAKVEGVPVDDKLLGSTTMFFRLLDDPEAGMAVGKILSIYEDGPTFKYPSNPDKVKIDPDDLTIGRKLWIKFRQPFLQKERFFEMEAEITMAVDLDGASEASKYRLRYTKIDQADQKVLDQFVKDQDLLRAEARPKSPQ